MPISRYRVEYVGLPQTEGLPVAVEQLDLLRSLIECGILVYLDETSCPGDSILAQGFWAGGPDQCAPLREAFFLEPVFELGGWHLYRLHPLSR